MNRVNWSNIPIPEGHVTLLVVGAVLHLWRPLRLFHVTWLRLLIGCLLLFGGILLAAWAVAAVNDENIERPTTIITAGPYAYSRNPMYLAWTGIYVATAVLVNTWWIFILLPVLLLFMHFRDVLQEERQLEEMFGEVYRQYRARVRRYF